MNHMIPPTALEKHLAILGTTGSGKSYTARGLVERLIHHTLDQASSLPRVCILDPKGDWFGLRLDKDGKKAGEDFMIIGGPHADPGLRLDEDHPEPMAEPLAQLVAGSDARTVIDLSDLDAGKMRRFVAAFLKTLYHENRRPLTLLVDEADEFAPQQPKGESAISLGAMERIAKRGRARGVRLWMVTQRPASLHKDVLGMAQTVVAMKMGLPHDRKAVKEWIVGQTGGEGKGQEAIEKAVVDSLPTLKTGEGWVWVMGEAPARVKFPMIRTFDSMRTPTEGGDFADIRLPAIDAGTLSAQLAEVVKEIAENDPKALKARIAELEKQLKATANDAEIMDSGRVAQLETERKGNLARIHELERQIRHHDERAYEFARDKDRWAELCKARSNECRVLQEGLEHAEFDLRRLADTIAQTLSEVKEQCNAAEQAFDDYGHAVRADMTDGPPSRDTLTVERKCVVCKKPATHLCNMNPYCDSCGVSPVATNRHLEKGTDARTKVHGSSGTTGAAAAVKVERPAAESIAGLVPRQAKILRSLAEWKAMGHATVSRAQCAFMAGRGPSSSSYERDLGELRTACLIDYPADGMLQLTPGGAAKVGQHYSPPTLKELQDRIRGLLEPRNVRIFDALISGHIFDRDTLSHNAGRGQSSSSYERDLGELRTIGLIDYPAKGRVRIAGWVIGGDW